MLRRREGELATFDSLLSLDPGARNPTAPSASAFSFAQTIVGNDCTRCVANVPKPSTLAMTRSAPKALM